MKRTWIILCFPHLSQTATVFVERYKPGLLTYIATTSTEEETKKSLTIYTGICPDEYVISYFHTYVGNLDQIPTYARRLGYIN
jgi:hypothetical protein